MTPKIAIIATTAAPNGGSEGAAAWSFLNELYLRSEIKGELDIYVSCDPSKERLQIECDGKANKTTRIIGVPIIWPKLHTYFGLILRVLWQLKVFILIFRRDYTLIHQLSPNSILYLNPIFFFPFRRRKLIVGPMRVYPFVSIKKLYLRDFSTLMRQISIIFKEVCEFCFLSLHRLVISRNVDIYINPILNERKASDRECYMPETAFIGKYIEKDGRARNVNRVIWSASSDEKRKNLHLALSIARFYLENTKDKNISFEFYGLSKSNSSDKRIKFYETIDRRAFQKRIDASVVYLMPSILEINSVLAEEVLQNGGRVVASNMEHFKLRSNSEPIYTVENYNSIDEWCSKLFEAMHSDKKKADADFSEGKIELLKRIRGLL